MKSIYLFLLACLISMGLPAIAQESDVSDVLTAQSAFEAAPSDETRTDLLSALDNYSGAPAIETVNAYMTLIRRDGNGGDAKKLRETARAAAAHFEPVKEIIPQQFVEAKFVAAVAYFRDDQAPDAMIEMAHVKGFATSYRDSLREHPDWANDLRWRADAWGMAMEAYFDSARKRSPTDAEIDAILARYPVPFEAETVIGEDSLPPCDGRMIQRPKVRYPAGKGMRGMYGAVILGFELDPEGSVVNPKILASVPVEEFDQRSLRTVGKWRFQPENPDQVGKTCRLERVNVVQPLIFQIR